jgi:hypothetical protein
VIALWSGCATDPGPPETAQDPIDAPAVVSKDPSAAWSSQVQAAIAAGEYAPQRDGAGFRVTNRAQDLRGRFGERGLAVTTRAGAGEVRLSLAAWGREGGLTVAEAVAATEGPCVAAGLVDVSGACVRQVTYTRPGLTEWWENGADGLEQGFTVTARPGGVGDLVFDLAVTGAEVSVAGDEATLRRPSGDPLRFGNLAAWDETGRSLPSWMEETSTGLRLVVDDTGAVGVVTVDPLLTTAGWTSEVNQTGANFGNVVAHAGDVNGDGFGDVVVGARSYDGGEVNEGRAYVFLGSASGLSSTAAWTAESNQAEAQFGFSAASAGDVNGDGFGDVVVGALTYSNGESGEGRVYVYLGSAAGLATTAAWTAESNQVNGNYGHTVSSAGDVNRDGYGDLVLGVPSLDNGAADEGLALVYLGSASGLAATPAWSAESDQATANFGWTACSAGDVNGDGYGDLVVGAPAFDNGQVDEGRAYVYLGNASGLAATAAWTIESNQPGARYGHSAAAAGDVNADGYGDVVVGAPFYDNGNTDEGQAYLYVGRASGLSTSPLWIAEPQQDGAGFGHAVASAGDVNGDGFADLVIGAISYDGGQTDEGRAYVYLSAGIAPATTASWTVESNQAGANFGWSVSAGGDVNGDGYGDVLIGAPFFDNGDLDEGRVSVFHGSASIPATSWAWSYELHQIEAHFGSKVASAGDVNGDGYDDVLVGAGDYDNGEVDEGRVMLFSGTANGLGGLSWTVESNQASAYFGNEVASAGDVNGDGYDDIVIGAEYYDNGHSQEGAAFVYLGGPSGPSTTPSWSTEGNNYNDRLGRAARSAGDVNGDGYDDLIVGTPQATNVDIPGDDEGRVDVFLGGPDGLSSTSSWRVYGQQADIWFGAAASSAGDVNGDGYGDVVVKA